MDVSSQLLTLFLQTMSPSLPLQKPTQKPQTELLSVS